MKQSKPHVLLVDDDRIFQFTAKRMLEATGLTGSINSIANGEEALAYLANAVLQNENVPDIIFLDINMPVMNGWNFLDTYKTIKTKINKDIIVYVVTSSADPLDVSKSNQYDVVRGYLVKPLQKQRFYEILSTFSRK